MNVSIRIDVGHAELGARQVTGALVQQVIVPAVDAGGAVLMDAYRNAIPIGRHPTGTYVSASGQVQSFLKARQGIGKRTRIFADGMGAYCIVGAKAAPGNWRPASPHLLWMEHGTAQREHKDKHPTGAMPRQGLLQRAQAIATTNAKATMIAVFKERLSRVVGN